jgi:hypothetical protein
LPWATAVDAMCLVHAKTGAAIGASPPGCLLGDNQFNADIPDSSEVFDDVNSVPGPVAGVKMQQGRTGVVTTRVTELVVPSGQFRTVFDFTCDAAFRLVAVVTPAAGAGLAIANVGAAQAAIYAAWRNDIRIQYLNLQDFVWHITYPNLFHRKVNTNL